MSVTPSDLLDVARALNAGEPQDEGFQRSAVSRAYYGALHAARLTFPPVQRMGGEGSHVAIIESARVHGQAATPRPGRAEARQVTQQLAALKIARVEADYEIALDFDLGKAAEAIARAETVIRLCGVVSDKMTNASQLGGA